MRKGFVPSMLDPPITVVLNAFWHWKGTGLKVSKDNDWAKILDNKGHVDTFVLDFEKAFDTPPHELLKSKLFSYGIGGKTFRIRIRIVY